VTDMFKTYTAATCIASVVALVGSLILSKVV